MSNTEYTVDVEVTEDITPAVDTGDATSSSLDDEQILLSAEISPDELVDAEVNTNEMVDITVQESVGSTETDHRLLTHRDAPDQHPMSAITGLNTSLQNMSASIDSRLTADENGIILLQVESDGHSQRLNVVEGDVVDAAKTATNYVTALGSTGIRLHTEDTASLNYITLDGDGMEVFNGAKSAAEFGEIARVGFEDGAHLEMDATGIRGISSDNALYFSVVQGQEGTMTAYDWLVDDSRITTQEERWFYLTDIPEQDSLHYDRIESNVSDAAYDYFDSLSNGDNFIIRVDYYGKASGGQTGIYDSRVYTFKKGTENTSDSYVKYRMLRGGHCVTVSTAVPPYSSPYYSGWGFKIMYGIQTVGYFPFYRFGTNVAQTGGASSFVIGTGTMADEANQFALGAYNEQTANSLITAGNGSSNNVRSNALRLLKTGDMAISGVLSQSSDRRLKEHIAYLNDDAVGFVRELKPAHFRKDGAEHVGFYAQEVEAADKWHCMTGEMNGFKTLGYTELIAPLVAYCQSLEKRIEELERN